MAVDITLDSIIRRNLAKRRLTLHYYGPFLVMAKEGLDEMHFDSLQKAKVAVIDIDPLMKTGDLPEDFVEEVMVGYEQGDKVTPMGFNKQLNKRDTDVPFERKDPLYQLSVMHKSEAFLIDTVFSGGYKGRQYGRPVTFTESFTILRDVGKIRIDNNSKVGKVHLIYLSLPEKAGPKSVIHPFAKSALDAYIDWQWSKYTKDRDQELRRRDFYNANRIFRARKNKMTTTEIKRSLRNNTRLSVKN